MPIDRNTPRESAVVAKCTDWLKTQPHLWFMKVYGGPYQKPGIPDLLICDRGYFVAAEVKRPGGKARPIQEATMAQMEEAGAIVGIVESLADLQALIARVDDALLGRQR